MSNLTKRRSVLLMRLAGLMAVILTATQALFAQTTTKCYFKDCIVHPDGTRICEVTEVPCPDPGEDHQKQAGS